MTLSKTMLAAVYHGPNDLRVEDVPLPQINADEVLIKVSRATICGTDLRILHGGHRKYPDGTTRIPGHEVVGTVAEVGQRTAGVVVGESVFVAPNIGNSSSRATISGNNNMDPNFDALGITLDGAFAEYMRIPAAAVRQGNLMPLDPSMMGVGPLIEPLACVLRGQNAVHLRDGDVVVIMGAGPIGMLHLKLANLRGATRVIISEPSEFRRQQALKLGADRVVNPLQEDLNKVVQEESFGRGADVIIVAAPSKPAQESALEIAAIGGRINLFGGLPKSDPFIRFNANTVHYKELVVTGTTACSTLDCLKAADLVNSGRLVLDDLITAEFSLHEATAAFTAAANGENLRVALQP